MSDVVTCIPGHDPASSHLCFEFLLTRVKSTELEPANTTKLNKNITFPVASVKFKIICEKWNLLTSDEKRKIAKQISSKIEAHIKFNKKKGQSKTTITYVPCFEKYKRARAQSIDSPFPKIPSETSVDFYKEFEFDISSMRKSKILNPKMLVLLGLVIPPLFKRKKWELVFSTDTEGVSMRTFYQCVENYNPTILLIKDSNGNVFGAYASEKWHNSKYYYGTGETFLFKFIAFCIRMIYQKIG